LGRTVAAARTPVAGRPDGEAAEARLGVGPGFAFVLGKPALVARAAALPPPRTVPAATGQFLDRRVASPPRVALHSCIGAPAEIRSVLARSATAHRARRRPGTVDRAGALMSKCRSKKRPGRTIY